MLGSTPTPTPPFLLNSDPMEPEDLPLQVALLTMEVASLRGSLAMLADLLDRTVNLTIIQQKLLIRAAEAIRPPRVDLDG